MYRKREEKLEFLSKILSDKQLFEEEVLHVFKPEEMEEVFSILAKVLVRQKYKEQLNFLYIKKYEEFDLSLLKSATTKEILQEFITYGVDVLYLSKEEMLEIASSKEHLLFITQLVQEYFKLYRHFLFNEISNTFLERVTTLMNENSNDDLIEEVLQSSLVQNENMPVMYTFAQLYKRVAAARDFKQHEKSSLQIKLSETRDLLAQENIDPLVSFKTKEKLTTLEEKLSQLNERSLDNYDAAIARLKKTMLASMQKFNYL
jgi:hypothetical protein